MHVIPESWSHLHILVSLFPLVGLLFVLGFYVASIVTNNDGLKRICLLVIVGFGVLSIPTYISGMASIMPVSEREGVTEGLINAHYNWSLYAPHYPRPGRGRRRLRVDAVRKRRTAFRQCAFTWSLVFR